MSLQFQEKDYCRLNVHYVAEAADVKEAKEKALKKLRQELKSQKVKVPGFRTKSATNQALETHFKIPLENFLKQELFEKAYLDFQFKFEGKPMFSPKLNSDNLHKSEYWCDFDVFIKPKVTLNKYKEFEIPKYYHKSSLEELSQKTLEELRRTFGDSKPYVDGDVVELGDEITLDAIFTDPQTGEKIEELSKEGMLHTVGNGIKELDQALLSMAPGETKTINYCFNTQEYPNELTVTQTVHMGMKKMPIEANDELAKKANTSSLDELMNQIHGMHSSSLKRAEDNYIKEQIFSRLLENNEVTPPDYLIEAEMRSSYKLTPEQLSSLSEEQRKQMQQISEKSVKLSLILDQIREEEPSCNFSQNEVLKVLADKLSASGQNAEQIIKNLIDSQRIYGAIANIKDSIVIEYIMSTCKFID